MNPEIEDRLKKLEEKFSVMGQDLVSYLDGLLHADYLTYWDYIHLDTLLSLQNPRTSFPDENTFIIYHQITELQFKLILNTCEEIANATDLNKDYFLERLNRINRYFESMIRSFGIMIQGMDRDQFLKFRMALLPASGFQSAQYRMIEFACTELKNLVAAEAAESSNNGENIEELLKNLYWRKGATELASRKKTLTLKLFEKKYDSSFLKFIEDYKDKNIWIRYAGLDDAAKQDKVLIDAMRQLDLHANVNWPLVHYKSAAKYLYKEPEELKATGGTNWQKYLPPKNQRIVFFRELWTEDELDNWGKSTEVDQFIS